MAKRYEVQITFGYDDGYEEVCRFERDTEEEALAILSRADDRACDDAEINWATGMAIDTESMGFNGLMGKILGEI